MNSFRAFFLGFVICISLAGPAAAQQPAPDIESPGPWLNSAPLTMQALKGKVVLVDFWTYSCINCLRTFPYLRGWYEAYKDQGFVIVGVHAPEFDFEKQQPNVEKAIKRFKITWPVVMDNDHLIWNRYKNRYWPAHYLINRDGQVVYTHFGEGNYDVTENTIRTLLGSKSGMAKVADDGGKAAYHQTPETYLGTDRGERLQNASLMNIAAQVNNYSFPREMTNDYWALDGDWQRYNERSVARSKGAALRMKFRAGKLYLVLGTEDGKPVQAKVLYNGQPATGKDAPNGIVTVTDHRLYELLDLKEFEEGVFEIQTERPGLEVYAFTFGG